MNDTRIDVRRTILNKALLSAPFDGWSQKTLESAISNSGIEAGIVTDAFPGGIKELLNFFMAEADRQMIEEATAQGLDEGPISKRISGIIRIRLEQLTPHREAIRRALAFQLLPGQGPNAAVSLWRTVDAIWYMAGDSSTDFNYYTKRALLAAIYSATVLRWLEDESENCIDTWTFLERRIASTMRIQKFKGRLQKTARILPNPLSPLRRFRYGR